MITARTRLPGPTEAEVQYAIRTLLQTLGWSVYRVGQHDARRTQDAGVPDLIAMHPTAGLVFIEVKRPGGRQSPAQRAFQDAARSAGAVYWLADSVAWVAEHVRARVAAIDGARAGRVRA